MNVPFKQMENITFFLEGCKKVKIDDLYIFVTVDLFEGKNLGKVLDCIFEFQKKFAPEEYRKMRGEAKDATAADDRIAIDKKDDQTKLTDAHHHQQAGLGQPVQKSSSIRTWNDDAELNAQLKYSPQLAQACKSWVAAVVHETFEESASIVSVLKDGVILCKLINTLKPNSVPQNLIHTGKMPFKQLENLQYYLKASAAFGIQSSDLFDVADLFEEKNVNMVLTHINALAKLAESQGGYSGPTIGDTSKAANMLGTALLAKAVEIDEAKDEKLSDEEKQLFEWANSTFNRFDVKDANEKRMKITNFQSLRSGIKLIALLKVLTGLRVVSGVATTPTTIMDFMRNATVFIRVLQGITFEPVKDCIPQNIANGDRVPLSSLLKYLQGRFDLETMYETFMAEQLRLLEVAEEESDDETPEPVPTPTDKKPSKSKDTGSEAKPSSAPKDSPETQSKKTSATSGDTPAEGSSGKSKSSSSKSSSKSKGHSKTNSSSSKSKSSKHTSESKEHHHRTKTDSEKEQASAEPKSKHDRNKSGSSPTDNASSKPSSPKEPALSPKGGRADQLKVGEPPRIRRTASADQINFAKSKAKAMMREHVVKEILQTERSYTASLEDIVKWFHDPVVSSNKIPAAELQLLLSNIKVLYGHHQKFLSKLDPIISSWSMVTTLGAQFKKDQVKFLMDYEPYLKNHAITNVSFKMLKRKYGALEGFVRDFESKLASKNSLLKIPDILIMPIQRIPRYIMLLQQLQKFSEDNKEEFSTLDAAQKNINELLLNINAQIDPEALSKAEAVANVIESITDLSEKDLPTNLFRRLLFEGGVTIAKHSNSNKKKLTGRKVQCWLFDDYMLLAAKKSKKDEEDSYTFVDAVPLVQINTPKFGDRKRQFEFKVEGDEVALEAKTDEETTQWVAALNGALAPSTGLSASNAGIIPRGFSGALKILEKK